MSTTSRPGGVVFLVDESAGMAAVMGDVVAGGARSDKSNAQRVATAINSLLKQVATYPDGALLDVPLAILGYQANATGQINVGSRWGGPLAGREFVTLAELAAAPLRVESRTRKIPAPGGFGPPREETVEFPVWYEPALGQSAPQVAAYDACCRLLSQPTQPGGDSGPPLVIHLQSGQSSDGNPMLAADRLLRLTTPSGFPIVVQIHLASSAQVVSAVYPSVAQYLTVGWSRDLFLRSSVLPDHFAAQLRNAKVTVNAGARAMLYNAKIADVIQALNLVKAHLQPSAVPPPLPPQMPETAPPAMAEDVPEAFTLSDLAKRLPNAPAQMLGISTAPPGPPPLPYFAEPLPPPMNQPPPMQSQALASPPLPLSPLPQSPLLQQPISQPSAMPPIRATGQPAAPTYTPFFPSEGQYSRGSSTAGQQSFEYVNPTPEHIVSPGASADQDMETFAFQLVHATAATRSGERAALVVLLLDRSTDDPHGDYHTTAFAKLQTHANDLLAQLARFDAGSLDVAVLSYGLAPSGNPDVRTTLEGSASRQMVIPNTELSQAAIRTDEVTEEISNGVGGLIAVTRRRPVFLELPPTAQVAPLTAFAAVADIIENWQMQHSDARVPPIVLHLTRGRHDPAMLLTATARLRAIETNAGPAALYHLICTTQPHRALAYPANDLDIHDPVLQRLWDLSGPLVGRERMSADKRSVMVNSRGFVVNGKFDLLVDGLRAALA